MHLIDSTICNTGGPAWTLLYPNDWLSAVAGESEWSPNGGEDEPTSLSASDSHKCPLQRRINLLLAEDNLPDVLLVREAIRMENLPLEVFVASDGERAIDFLVRAENDPNAPGPDVLLLDINLPKVDGLEVLRRIRSRRKFKDTPVLIITSSDSPADRSEAASLGAGYFRKPPNYEEFLKIGPALKRVLEENGLL